jgi:hypothetical protein
MDRKTFLSSGTPERFQTLRGELDIFLEVMHFLLPSLGLAWSKSNVTPLRKPPRVPDRKASMVVNGFASITRGSVGTPTAHIVSVPAH